MTLRDLPVVGATESGPMRVWLVQPGEPLPGDAGNPRLLRTGLLAERLAAAGHEVTWWATTFDHATKRQRSDRDTVLDIAPGYRLILLHSPGYRTNISLRRFVDHRILGYRFRSRARAVDRPDVVHCSFPTIELAYETARLCRAAGVPYVLDARDMWPDIFVDAASAVGRPVVRALLSWDFHMTRYAFRAATAITAHAPGFVAWGLKYAGREPTDLDVDFPFAYPIAPVDSSALASALDEWQAAGVRAARDAFNICFFGTFAERDEVDLRTVIEAARLVQDDLPQVRIVLCGAGPSIEEIRARAARLGNVVIPGRVDLTRIRALMQISKLGLLPYLPSKDFLPSLPNKSIEYLSGALPILTSLSGGYLETVLARYGCGRFYQGGNAESLAAAIRAAVEEPESLQRQKNAAARAFDEHFRADVVMNRMIAHLEAVRRRSAATAARGPGETRHADLRDRA